MNLEEINKELLRIAKELAVSLPKLKEAEYKYNMVYFDALLHSGMGNAQAREAESYKRCDTEGVLKPFEELKVTVRTLITEKECYIEIAKNIRTLRGHEYA